MVKIEFSQNPQWMLLLGQRWLVSKGASSGLQHVTEGKGKAASTLQRYKIHSDRGPDEPSGQKGLELVHRLAARPFPETHTPCTEPSGISIRGTWGEGHLGHCHGRQRKIGTVPGQKGLKWACSWAVEPSLDWHVPQDKTYKNKQQQIKLGDQTTHMAKQEPYSLLAPSWVVPDTTGLLWGYWGSSGLLPEVVLTGTVKEQDCCVKRQSSGSQSAVVSSKAAVELCPGWTAHGSFLRICSLSTILHHPHLVESRKWNKQF